MRWADTGGRWALACKHRSLLLLLNPYFQLLGGSGEGARGQGPCGRQSRCCCPPGPLLPGQGLPNSPAPALPPRSSTWGQARPLAAGLPLPWKNTNTHQCSLETRARSPGRKRREGKGEGRGERGMAGSASAMVPGRRRQAQSPLAVPDPSSPPALSCTPSPNRQLCPPRCAPGPLHAQHPIQVLAAHWPRPRQNWAVPMSLGATQGTEGSRNAPVPNTGCNRCSPESTLLQAACKHIKKWA